jgi:hypothetical protein
MIVDWHPTSNTFLILARLHQGVWYSDRWYCLSVRDSRALLVVHFSRVCIWFLQPLNCTGMLSSWDTSDIRIGFEFWAGMWGVSLQFT